ncbi:MAG: DNA polymerase IV [Nocardioides sp.]|jgi:DNA polymerase-4
MSDRTAGGPFDECPILHVDMDAFYASVALRDRPELVDVPVIVGGGYRGVVLSANYPARTFGVRSGMPSTRARRLCPQAVILHPDYEEVSATSTAIMETFRRVTPLVEVISLDEAFLDVRSARRRAANPRQLAERLRAEIADEQGINCSVGVAPSMLLAKMASKHAKPDGPFADGICVVRPDEITSFLHPMDVGALWGVGEKTRELLHRLGLFTIGDLAHTPVRTLGRALGENLGRHLHDLAWGIDRRPVTARRGAGDSEASMGANETFSRDTDDREVIARELLRLTAKVASRMRTARVAGRTVTITVRFADFTTITRAKTLAEPTDVTVEIYRTALGCFDALGLQRARIRLVGVRVEGLRPRTTVHRQLVLGERDHGWADADRAVDRAVGRFGAHAVRPASLIS